MAYSTSSRVATRAFCAVALLLGALIGCGTVKGAKSFAALRVVSAGRPQAAIVLGKAAGELSKYAATELQKYLRILSGVEVPIISEDEVSSRPSKEALILVGGPSSNSAIREAAQAKWVNFTGLKPEGFVLKTGDFKGHPAIVAGGNDDASAMYAAYELIERLGVTFTLAGDAVPAVRSDLSIPVMDIHMVTPLLVLTVPP